MRNLVTVIDQMLNVIPTENASFIAALRSRRDSVEYSAPELMGLRWESVAETLSDYISQDETLWTDWQKEVVKIWMGK
jgi:hypothetical protein